MYRRIQAQHDPADIGDDALERNRRSINFLCYMNGPTTTMEQEIRDRLISESVCTAFGTDVFIGRKTLPSGDGPFTRIIKTAGIGPLDGRDPTSLPTSGLQIVTTARDYETCQTKAQATLAALHGLTNTELTAT